MSRTINKSTIQQNKATNSIANTVSSNARATLSPPPFSMTSSPVQKKAASASSAQAPVQFSFGSSMYKGLKTGIAGTGVGNMLSGGRIFNALGPVKNVLPFVNVGTGIADATNSNNSMPDRVAGGARAAGGAGGIGALMGLLPSIGGAAGLGGATLGGAGSSGLLATGAGAGFGAGATLAASGAAVAGAGAAGYGIGRGLDMAADWVGDKISGNEAADHSISGMAAADATQRDRSFTRMMRSAGVYDSSAPEYTQTIGWRLAEALPSWMQ